MLQPKINKLIKSYITLEKSRREIDGAELYGTGQIKNPVSTYYKTFKKRDQPALTQDNIDPRFRKRTDQLAKESTIEDAYLKRAAITANVAQAGHFIPHPMTQGAAIIGDVVGASVAARQAYKAYKKNDYTDMTVNASGIILPSIIGRFGFTRNTKWSPLSRKVDKILGDRGRTNYVNLTERVKGQSNLALSSNRALATGVVAETAYEVGAPFEFKKAGLLYKNNIQHVK